MQITGDRITLLKCDNGWSVEYSNRLDPVNVVQHRYLVYDYDELVAHLMTLYPARVGSVGELMAHQQFADATLPGVSVADPAEA